MRLYPTITWPQMKTKAKLDKRCYDIADSIVVALAIKRDLE